MYKRRRLAQPALPTSQDDADAVVRSSRYSQLDGEEFYRGVVDAELDGSALVFASRKQLQMLETGSDIYFDATFKVVPRLYFSPASAMADFEEASVSAFRCVFGDITVTGCWFHFAQSIIKRVNKVGLKDEYMSEPDVQDIVRCLLGLPLLPADDICLAFDEVKLAMSEY